MCIMALVSCSWVKDDYDDCPTGFWLKLNYTYNILDVEAATKYVKGAYVYIYDAEGKFVKRQYVNTGDLAANNYRVRVEGLPEGTYQFIIWCGIDDQFAVAGENGSIDEFRLTLLPKGGANSYNGQLPNLFYGYLSNVHFDDSYSVQDVNLTKNNKQLNCLVTSVDNKVVLDPNSYNMKIISANSVMNAYNSTVAEAAYTYMPNKRDSVVINDETYGVLRGIQFSIPTLRLMDKHKDRIVLEKATDGKKLFDISLSDYLGVIGKFNSPTGRELTVQEYLDRQDYYTVVFILSDDLERLIELRVNSWRLRAYNHLKL